MNLRRLRCTLAFVVLGSGACQCFTPSYITCQEDTDCPPGYLCQTSHYCGTAFVPPDLGDSGSEGQDSGPAVDGGQQGRPDGSGFADAGDAGVSPVGPDGGHDGGVPDGGLPDGGFRDGGQGDGGLPDGGSRDGGVPDGGSRDAGTPDAGACGSGTTSVSGTVYAPTPALYGSPDPLPNALVYVPGAALTDFTPSVACETCADVAGSPVTSAKSLQDGTFRLDNVPAGSNVPLVIQIGRWRRYVEIPTVQPCVNNPLTDPNMTRLPRTEGETSIWDNIPQIAMVTGSADPMECVLRKIGIADAEFTTPTGTVSNSSPARSGRVHLYVNNGASLSGSPTVDTLMQNPAALGNYDAIIVACDGMGPGSGGGYTPTSTEQMNLINYTNSGGRLLATHYSYAWLYNDQPFEGTATWSPETGQYPSVEGVVNQTFTDGLNFAKWLVTVGASTSIGNIALANARNDFTNINGSEAQLWMTAVASGNTVFPLYYAFNTPIGLPADQQCGRVLFSDFHTATTSGTSSGTFPSECDSSPLSSQEKALEFMLFDLTNCVHPYAPQGEPDAGFALDAGSGSDAGRHDAGGVQCVSWSDCPSGDSCLNGSCFSDTSVCGQQCPATTPVCDGNKADQTYGQCVACLRNADCGDAGTCITGTCTSLSSGDAGANCTNYGATCALLCSVTGGTCDSSGNCCQ